MTSTAEFGDVRQRRRRSRSVDPDVLKFIQRHATETDAGAMAIYRAAEVQYGESRLPSERTVRSIVAAERPEDTSGLWSVGTGIEEPSVLETLAAIIETSGGRSSTLTNGEAEWIARLAHLSPTLPPWERFVYARRYIARVTRGEPTHDLDAEIALWG